MPHSHPAVLSRWRRITRKARVTPARWWSSSPNRTDPAIPPSPSSRAKFCPTASSWPGVRIAWQNANPVGHYSRLPFLFLEPPKENGGADVTKYVVEMSEGLSGELKKKKKAFLLVAMWGSNSDVFTSSYLCMLRFVVGAGVFGPGHRAPV